MTGIYIHIPFCRKACHYCNFHFSTSVRSENDLIDALLNEAEIRKSYLGNSTIDTLYIGGGTPSLLAQENLEKVFNKLFTLFNFNSPAEITLEANPDDLTDANASFWRSLGVNRLSIGIQSFQDEDLVWMNRSHNAGQAVRSIEVAQRHFDELTIDLIYGSPTLSDSQWAANLERAATLGITHLSCYALTVEPRTALEKLIEKKEKEPVQSETQARQFLMAMDFLEEKGWEHYEISNFALPGHRSRHNSGYWNGMRYLGLGPSAHSYDQKSRQWNIANNALYISGVRSGQLPVEKEQLTRVQQCNEYLLTKLRIKEGIDPTAFENLFGQVACNILREKMKQFEVSGQINCSGGHYCLTKEGKLFADAITADLFFESLPEEAVEPLN
jgi:oxygen-independent coproporphyrinogen-3 oxidase